MMHMPPEIQLLVLHGNRIASEIQRLNAAKSRLQTADFKQLAILKAELLIVCPPERYVWLDGKPVVDILKTLYKIKKEIKHETTKRPVA